MPIVPFLWRSGENTPVTKGWPFSRADASTCATYVSAAGIVTTVAANVLRYQHYAYAPTMGLSYLSDLLEGARTNDALWCRDLTNAAWTKTNITPTATVGADGGATSATRLTATGANGTAILAALVHGSQARTGSFLLKRITGTGNVDITLDNGATWTTVTLTAAYSLLSKTQTLANSQFGIRLVTSGDVVDVDFAQNEARTFASSRIATTTVSVTSASDVCSAPWNYAPQALTWYGRYVSAGNTGAVGEYLFQIGAGTTSTFAINTTTNGRLQAFSYDGSSNVNVRSAGPAIPVAGDLVEVRYFLAADFTIVCGVTINGGAEVLMTGGTNVARTTPAAFSNALLTIGDAAAGSSSMFAAWTHLGIALAPEQSLAAMRTIATTYPVTPTLLTTTTSLDACAPSAEIGWFGQPRFTVIDTGTNAALTATATPGAGQQARLFHLTVSASAAPTLNPLRILDGNTVIWQTTISATGPFSETFDFAKKPLRSSAGNTLTADWGAPGGTTVATLSWEGDYVRAP